MEHQTEDVIFRVEAPHSQKIFEINAPARTTNKVSDKFGSVNTIRGEFSNRLRQRDSRRGGR